MDEERKAAASHTEMCFPDWLNEAGGIKGVNHTRGCLGATQAGLRMRWKQSKSQIFQRSPNMSHPRTDLWRSPSPQGS